MKTMMLLLAATVTCGTERWDVKTLSDPAAGKIDLRRAKAATIEELNKLGPSCELGPNAPRQPGESILYDIVGKVRLVKREEDGDIHIVMEGDRGALMIVEVPSPQCAPNSVADFHQVRRVASTLRHGRRIEVMGVAFYDKSHGQFGESKSCVELHPVLSITVQH